jgi:hypothetical protein
MDKSTLKNIFKFLEEKGEHKAPFKWKLENNIPLSKEELNVKGTLRLSYSDITSLPEGLKVGDNLNLQNSEITSLPKNLKVGASLLLYYCKNITSLPEGLQVGGNLSIFNTPLVKLSDETILSMIEPDGYINGYIIRR